MRNLLVILLVGLLALTFFVVVWTQGNAPKAPVTQEETAPESVGKADIGGSFSLIDQDGKPVTDEDLRGKHLLVFFGFTYCPDVCPVTLALLTNVLEGLGKQADKVQTVLISVDPERDTPERLKEYLASFHPSVIGLTGEREDIKKVANAYKAYFSGPQTAEGEPVEMDHSTMDHGDMDHAAMGHTPPAENYLVNHSSFIYLMDERGEYVTHFSPQDSERKIIEAIQEELD